MTHFPASKRVYRGNGAAEAVALPISAAMRDGLAVPQARSKARRQWSLPLREAMPLVAVFLLLRIVIAADMGAAGYIQKTNALAEGTPFEQLVAKAMPLDPVSQAAAGGLSVVLAFASGR